MAIVCVIVVAVLILGDFLEPEQEEETGPDFELSADPASLTMAKGSSANVTIVVTSVNGFNSTVTFSGFASPVNIVLHMDFYCPGSATPTQNGEVRLTQTVYVGISCPAGIAVFTFTGQSGQPSLSHKVSVDVTVTD